MSKINCPLTGVLVNSDRQSDTIFYKLEFLGHSINVLWCYDCYKEAIRTDTRFFHHIVKGLIVNNKLPEDIFLHRSECMLSGISDGYERLIFPNFLDTISFPRTASQKMDNLLFNLYKKQSFDGEHLSVKACADVEIYKNYFKNNNEIIFYLKSLTNKGFIVSKITSTETNLYLTHEGLNRIVELEEKSVDSNSCFVAMAFDSKTDEYREAIKRALIAKKYEHILIDEEHLESDKTIPDAILNKIRKAKFVIADFTLHRNGVYFESGYALGLGKQVIYTCREDDFKNAHFDIKQLQHVLYKTPEELEKKLVDKIEFWIK
ncbi:MAG: hypothetical protein AB7O47_00695 [Flavobacteriales bacterium]